MINRKNHTPLYIQLTDHIRKLIALRNIKAGDKLPSETKMIKEYKLGGLLYVTRCQFCKRDTH